MNRLGPQVAYGVLNFHRVTFSIGNAFSNKLEARMYSVLVVSWTNQVPYSNSSNTHDLTYNIDV